MKIFYRISFFGLLLIATVNQTLSQNSIKWVLDENASAGISESVPEGKALLIFESQVNLTFDSSVENLEQPTKKSGKYYLYVNTGPQAITIKYMGNYDINFGILQASGSLAALKNKEIKYFKISEIRNLVCEDITDLEIAKGNSGVPIGVNVSDALVIINVYPPDLEIQITDDAAAITKQSKEEGNYKVFVKAPGNHKLIIKHPGFNDKEIKLKDLVPKTNRFYRIIKLSTLEDYSNEAETQTTSLEKDYSKILGYWGGSLGETETYLELNQESETDQVIGRIYQNGLYSNLRGMVRMKTMDEFRMTLNQRPNNTSGEGATLDLIFKKGILNGVSVSDNGDVKDLTMMRVQSIPKEKTDEENQNFETLKKHVEGTWLTTAKSLFPSISIYNIDIKNNLTGIVNLSDGKKCKFNGVLNEKNGYLSLILNFQADCGTCAGTLTLRINPNSSYGNFTSNDGNISQSLIIKKL